MNKKIILFLVSALVLSFFYTPVSAEETATTTSYLQELIDLLRSQIEELIAQITALLEEAMSLQEIRQETKEEMKEVKSTLKLIRQLRIGMRGEDVELLQEILATDPEIYPEGLITGYFGKLTENAVKKFQKIAGIEQVGIVGPKTLSKINELLEEGAGSSGKVPPGLLIAPGIRKKLGFAPQPLPGQELPPGISKKLATSTEESDDEEGCINSGGTVATSSCCLSADDFPNLCLIGACGCPPEGSHEVKICNCGEDRCFNGEECVDIEEEDIIAPVISDLAATNITATSAEINWMTDEGADSKVWYSTSTPLVIATSTPMMSSINVVLSHEVLLSDLTTSTTYYYLVSSTDDSGNTATSTEQSFTTL